MMNALRSRKVFQSLSREASCESIYPVDRSFDLMFQSLSRETSCEKEKGLFCIVYFEFQSLSRETSCEMRMLEAYDAEQDGVSVP